MPYRCCYGKKSWARACCQLTLNSRTVPSPLPRKSLKAVCTRIVKGEAHKIRINNTMLINTWETMGRSLSVESAWLIGMGPLLKVLDRNSTETSTRSMGKDPGEERSANLAQICTSNQSVAGIVLQMLAKLRRSFKPGHWGFGQSPWGLFANEKAHGYTAFAKGPVSALICRAGSESLHDGLHSESGQ